MTADTVEPAPEPALPLAAGPGAGSAAAALVAFVAAHDAACPVCGYSLRGLREARCPECAAPLHLQVGSENLRLGPWFLAVLSFALALGFDGVVSLVMSVAFSVAYVHERPSIGQMWPMLMMLSGFITLAAVSGAGVWLVFRRRPAFMRLRRRTQWVVAGAVFGAVFLVHATFGLVLTRVL